MTRKQRPRPKPPQPNAKKGRFANAAKWLQDSPVKVVIVAAAASLAFISGAVGGGWTLYQSYRESMREVTIRVSSVEAFATMRLVTAAQMSGMASLGPDHPLSNMGAELPTIVAALEIENPTASAVNIRACTLTVRDKGRKPVVSEGSYSFKGMRDRVPETPPVWKMEPKSILTVERFFAFSQADEVAKALTSKDVNWTMTREFEAACLVDDEVITTKPFSMM